MVGPSSRKTDRFPKPGEYADVPLFWRVGTDPRLVVHAHGLRAGAYVETARVDVAGEAPVPGGALRLVFR